MESIKNKIVLFYSTKYDFAKIHIENNKIKLKKSGDGPVKEQIKNKLYRASGLVPLRGKEVVFKHHRMHINRVCYWHLVHICYIIITMYWLRRLVLSLGS